MLKKIATNNVETIECILTIAEHGAASPLTAACRDNKL